MLETPAGSSQLTHHLRRLADGEREALDDLIAASSRRLQQLTRQMLSRFAGVRRWEQTDDILQNAMLRLLRALDDVQPSNGVAFLALAALQIRRELIDLARRYFGPEGQGANHASWPDGDADSPTIIQPNTAGDPSQLAEWRELHELVDRLPDDERDVVSLVYYHGLMQAEAGEMLGVSVRTVQRRWQSALLGLHRMLKEDVPADA